MEDVESEEGGVVPFVFHLHAFFIFPLGLYLNTFFFSLHGQPPIDISPATNFIMTNLYSSDNLLVL